MNLKMFVINMPYNQFSTDFNLLCNALSVCIELQKKSKPNIGIKHYLNMHIIWLASDGGEILVCIAYGLNFVCLI